jgi:hypothetical protein
MTKVVETKVVKDPATDQNKPQTLSGLLAA